MVESIAVALRRAADLTADGNPTAAISLLRGVLDEHPTQSEAWCRLAVAHLDAGEPEPSLDAAKEAIRLGERSWAHRLASLALLELGRTGEAVVSARESVRRDQSDWRCHVALAEALGGNAPQEAFAAAHRASRLAHNESRPFEVLGDAAVRVQDRETARAAYRYALRLDPTNQHVRTNLVRLGRPALEAAPGAAPAPPKANFGRVERIALWLMVRRAGVALGLGALLLLLAGQPSPSGVLGWFGAVLIGFVAVLVIPSWLRFARGVQLRVALRAHRLLAISGALLAASTLMLTGWTVAIALGARTLQPLTLVMVFSLAAGGIAGFALWRGARPAG